MTRPVLDVNVVATRTTLGPTAWLAEVGDFNSPLSGLFAFGPTFDVARAALAATIWSAVVGAPDRHRLAGVDPDRVRSLNLITVTRKSFAVSKLAGRVGR